MALQDLTPQLRTRLNRMERAVGWFVFVAAVLLVFGFGYFLYHTAERRGWFLVEARFYTYVSDASGLKVGAPVMLMGFQVGQISGITAMPPRSRHNIRIEFYVNQITAQDVPYYSYVWSEGSRVKVNSDLLGNRSLEITRGTNGYNVYLTRPLETFTLKQARNLSDPQDWRLAENLYDKDSNLVFRAFITVLWPTNVQRIAELQRDSITALDMKQNRSYITAIWNRQLQRWEPYNHRDESGTNAYQLAAAESPSVMDKAQAMITQIQKALPGVLSLTNKIADVLDNTANATSNLNVTLGDTRPLLTNFAALSAQLREPGSLGVWMLGTNGEQRTQSVVGNVDTNLALLSLTLNHLADITSNLNAQVQANTNMLGSISKTVADADDFVQGLKRFWLFRSTFKHENKKQTNAPPINLLPPRLRQER